MSETPELGVFVLGVLTPFILVAAFAAVGGALERWREWRKRGKRPAVFTGVTAHCPRTGCEWTCSVFTTPKRQQRRRARHWVWEHIQEDHASDERESDRG